MSIIQSTLINTISNLSEDKLTKVLSYAVFLQNEQDNELEFSLDDENELLQALANDERIDSSVVEKRFQV